MTPKDPSSSSGFPGVPGEIELELAGPGHMSGPSAAQDVPDLDLGPRKGPPPSPIQLASTRPGPMNAPMSAPPASKRAAPGKPVAGGLDDDADLMKGPGFDLDFGAEGAPGAAPAPVLSGLRAAGPAPASILQSEDGGKAAAQKLGDYGEAPVEWWKAPLYAYRVKVRQMELRKELTRKRGDLETAQNAVEDALVVLAERGRKVVHAKDSYSKHLGAVIAAEHTLRERDSALAAEAEAHAKQTAGLDERIAQHEAELAGARAEEKAVQDVFERADAVRQRADAKVKRIDIELRSATARASGKRRDADPAGPPSARAGSLPDAEVQARTAEREARLAELDASMPAVTEAAQRLAVARKKTSAVEQKMLAVKNERASLENQFRKRGAAHGKQVALAQRELRSAMAALGRAMAVDTATFGAEWTEARSEIAALEKAVTSRDDEVMLHVMALDAHEPSVVSKGIAIAAGAVVGLILLVSVPVALNVASNLRPPPKQAPAADTAE